MKTTTLFLTVLFAAALVAVTGCRSTSVNTLEPASKSGQPRMISDERVLADQSLNDSVRFIGINTATGAEGFLKIQVQAENTTRTARSFTYRVEWFDENGMIIDQPTTAARPRTIEAGEVLVITATAPTPSAKDFRIKFLEPTIK
jgi:uncharacterized protein YcfL